MPLIESLSHVVGRLRGKRGRERSQTGCTLGPAVYVPTDEPGRLLVRVSVQIRPARTRWTAQWRVKAMSGDRILPFEVSLNHLETGSGPLDDEMNIWVPDPSADLTVDVHVLFKDGGSTQGDFTLAPPGGAPGEA